MAEQAPLVGPAHKRSTHKHCLLYVAALLLSLSAISIILVLLSQLGGPDGTAWRPWSGRRRHTPRTVTTLPAMPEDDRLVAAQLFRYLSRPSSGACRRLLRFGGSPSLKLNGMVASLVGGQMACLDPEFSLTAPDCLVYSLRQGGDLSLEAALRRYGCRVHTFDPTAAADAADELLAALDRAGEPVALLSATAPGADDLLLSRPAVLRRVEQLALRLDFGGRPAGAETAALLRRRYGQLLRLQQLGFRPLAFELDDADGALNMTVPGLREPLTSVVEVVLMNTDV